MPELIFKKLLKLLWIRKRACFSGTYSDLRGARRSDSVCDSEQAGDRWRHDGSGNRTTLRHEPAGRVAAPEGLGARRAYLPSPRRPATPLPPACRASGGSRLLVRTHPTGVASAPRSSRTLPRKRRILKTK